MRSTISISIILIAVSAFASNNRSAVSLNGSDLNPCTTAQPCRSFTAAKAQTNAGGEIIALDSAGYGPFTISQSVTVSGAPGIHAAITATAGDGIQVSASVSGIFTTGAVRLTIDRCRVIDNSGAYGFEILNGGVGTISNCVISGNNTGASIEDNSSIAIAHCIFSGNNAGIVSSSFGGGTVADALLEDCTVAGGAGGVFAGSGGLGVSHLQLSNSVIFGNGVGVQAGTGGTIYSFGNNKIIGNTTDISGGTKLSALSLR